MLLYRCAQCGYWCDWSLGQALQSFAQSFAMAMQNKQTTSAQPSVPNCLDGHGPMTQVHTKDRLFAWTPPTQTEQPHHDGHLDGGPDATIHQARVEIQPDYSFFDGSRLIEIDGGHGDCENSRILLDPAQALSLLAWLKQEKPRLEQMVSEDAK